MRQGPSAVDGGGKRGQNSGGLVTFHSAPFPLGRGCSLRTARSGQGRAGVARRSEPFTARTVLRSSTRGKGVALNGPLKWPSRSPPLTYRRNVPTLVDMWIRRVYHARHGLLRTGIRAFECPTHGRLNSCADSHSQARRLGKTTTIV